MTIGRTHDLRIAVGHQTDLYLPRNIVGGGITGVTNIEPEGFLGQTYEQASVHSAGSSVTFGTIYDTETFDTAVRALIGDGLTDPTDDIWYVVWSEAAPRMWRAIPVDFGPPGSSAPAAGSITRSWKMTGRNRGLHGTNVIPFTTTAGAAYTLVEDFAADAQMVLIITDVASAVTDLHWNDGSGDDHGIARASDELIVAALTQNQAESADLTITSDGGAVTGICLIGNQDFLPSG